MRRKVVACGLALAGLAAAEGLARLALDFPLYEADSEVGYWYRPDQHGTFLFVNDWVFNTDGLGVAEQFRPSDTFDVVLVGDSVVAGGNGLPQRDKLAPTLERQTGWQVWPVAAGGWALQNEMAFLARKPALIEGADAIVFIVEALDFAEPAQWVSPANHPRERPALYLPYLFTRYVLRPEPLERSPFPVARRDVLEDWLQFARAAGKPVFVVAYSTQEQSGEQCRWVPHAFRAAGKWSCYDGLAVAGEGAFRDAIHPSASGNRALAAHLAAWLKEPGFPLTEGR